MSGGTVGLDAPATWAGPDSGPRPVAFTATVQLSKCEVFAACQALADADRVLVATGSLDVAEALGDLFELLEQRLTAV